VKVVDARVLQADGGGGSALSFLRLGTDDGLVGWSEFSDTRWARGLVGVVEALAADLIGRDPRPVAALTRELSAVTRLARGGLNRQAVAAIENACLDLKAKALGVPVYELFGGPFRDRVRAYWSHCGLPRLNEETARLLGVPPLRTLADVEALAREVVDRGFDALKITSMAFDEHGPRHQNPGFLPGLDQARPHSRAILDGLCATVEAFRSVAGPDMGIALDVNFGFSLDGFRRLAKRLEPFDLMWLEVDVHEPEGLALLRSSTATPIGGLETLHGLDDYRPYFEARAVDTAIIDVMWNGLAESVRIASLAESFQLNVNSHGYTGPLAATMAGHFAAAAPNVQISEYDVDQVPWYGDLVTVPPRIEHGTLFVPSGPGWGPEVNEEAVAEHPPPPGPSSRL
jgi:galactonate dehydratase